MSLLADLLSSLFERRRPGLPRGAGDGERRDAVELAHAMMAAPGEDAQRLLAAAMLERYAACDDEGRRSVFLRLAREMDVDPEAVRDALDAYERAPGGASYRAFVAAAEPPRQEVLRRINRVTGATGRIVAMRADLRRLVREGDDALGALDEDFRHLLSSWFNRGFLVLRPISWETPAHILEKIIAYEAVHAIASWDDLRGRLRPADRRCFGFFHPAMPDEPLIFVEVALTRGIPTSIGAILAQDRAALEPEEADTACFYSISNCQPGLAGISFGNSLIKQVVADLRAECPGVATFVTLSPIPGLTGWLEAEGHAADEPEALRRLAAAYLLTAKGRGGAPRDPVARFHLGNGASVHAVHLDADTSERGLAQSRGMMVSYLYDPARVERNHARHAEAGEIAAASAVRSLAAEAARARGRQGAP